MSGGDEVGSPPSPLSSGCPTPPSVDDDAACETPPSPPATPSPRLSPRAEVHDDPPVLPAASIALAASAPRAGAEPGPFAPQNVKHAPLSELLLFAFALVQVVVFLVVEADAFTTVRGLGLLGAFTGGWLLLGLVSVVKCPVAIVTKSQLVAAFLSVFFCSKLLAFLLLLSTGAVVGLLSVPVWLRGSLDLLFIFAQRKNNRS